MKRFPVSIENGKIISIVGSIDLEEPYASKFKNIELSLDVEYLKITENGEERKKLITAKLVPIKKWK